MNKLKYIRKMRKLTLASINPTNATSIGRVAVNIIPREAINTVTNNTTILTNFPAGTHSVYNIVLFFWILFSLIIFNTNLILFLSPSYINNTRD